jgi:hypothetical protein
MPAKTTPSYDEKLRTLSEGSVHQHFDAFLDIAWDSPEFAVVADDPRWILPKSDALGRHPWYQSLPQEQQIAIGMWRQANVAKVGLQFENLLIRGVMEYVMTVPNGSAEFRYCTHEVTEETHHTQMFQEFVNRLGVDVPGTSRFFRTLSPFLPLVAHVLPEIFFLGILAGEEPIDHLQKAILRDDAELHPLMQRIMQIHVAEEARHISFAHEYLRHTTPQLNPVRKALLSVAFPIALRWLANEIMVPSKEITTKAGVPREVVKEVFWDSPAGRELLQGMFGDVRALADEIGVVNPVTGVLWKVLGINGKASRFRGAPTAEPATAPAEAA